MRNSYIFIQENTFENIACEMAAFFIFSLNVLKYLSNLAGPMS